MNKIITFVLLTIALCSAFNLHGFGVAWESLLSSTMDSSNAAICTLDTKWFWVSDWDRYALLYSIADTVTGTDSIFYRIWVQYSTDTTSTAYNGISAIDSLTSEGTYWKSLSLMPSLYARFKLISTADNGRYIRISQFNISKQH